jgi:hypothetical protein
MVANPTKTRIALGVLALVQGPLGLWAVFAPRSFYDHFPGGGRHWVALSGHYDHHLVTDVGALSLALTVVLIAAAWTADRRLVLVAAGAWLAWSIPHLVFHLGHDHVLPSADHVVSDVGQALTVVLAAGLLIFNRQPPEASS